MSQYVTRQICDLSIQNGSMSSSLTENYQNALPYALLGASPSLAALHATRSRLLNPYQMDSLRSTHCSRCGTFGGEVRVYRSGRTRFLQRTCRACGFRDDVATDRGNAAVYTGRKKKGNRLVPDIRQTETTGETSDLSTR